MMFEWFKRRREAKRLYEADIANANVAPRLHGINLLEWRYVGRTVISYCDHFTKEITSSATVFGFCRISDINDRQFVVTPHVRSNEFNYHTWVMEHASLWSVGERNIWEIAHTEPSRWLREYMDENFGEIWNHEDCWWMKKGAVPKKKVKLEIVKDTSSDNVVKLDFSKKKEDGKT